MHPSKDTSQKCASTPPSNPIYRESQAAFEAHEVDEFIGKKEPGERRLSLHRAQKGQDPKAPKFKLPVFGYEAERYEDGSNLGMAANYPISPIRQIIPFLLKEKAGKQVNIIDLGAGSAQYTDLIRDTFKDQVKVSSTGISKKTANIQRRIKGLDKLHSRDLKWRSIQELKPEPEFDLILSCFGEFYYGVKQNPKQIELVKESPHRMYRKLEKVMTKLNDGGIACLSPVNNKRLLKEALERIAKKKSFSYDVEFLKVTSQTRYKSAYQVIIRKNAQLPKDLKKSWHTFLSRL